MRTPIARFKPIPIGRLTEVSCGCCSEPLELHQPDVDRPDRLLGTCPECGAWFLIDPETQTLIALPDLPAARRN